MDRHDVVLIVPPFASIDYPMIGPSILKGACTTAGIKCHVFYANVELASVIGYDLYERIGLSSFSLMLGELLFRDFSFPNRFNSNIRSVIQDYFSSKKTLNISTPFTKPIKLSEIYPVLDVLPIFLKKIELYIQKINPKIIGLSSVFQQNLASITIAKIAKRVCPDTKILLGGANASSPMGDELAKNINDLDYIFSGEADEEFIKFLKNYFDLGCLPDKKMIDCPPVVNMDAVPSPVYDDYFEQLGIQVQQRKLPSTLPKGLPIETSRGCWWGAKKHCTFCGLNGKEMSFRDKSADKILNDIEQLADRFNVQRFQATDNIMPYTFHSTVLPRLAVQDKAYSFFYEVKSNLKERDLDLFILAGINVIQPGIESFSSNILSKIEKGVTGIQNIWLLRECQSRKIQPVWNILASVPGDCAKDYTDMLDLVKYIEHLTPPRAVSPIVIDRYSPYHSRPYSYKMSGVEPLSAYHQIYPPEFKLSELAYHFMANYESFYLSDKPFAEKFRRSIQTNWIDKWRPGKRPPLLYSVPFDKNRLFIEDTRSCALESRFVLDSEESNLLKKLTKPYSVIAGNELEVLQELLRRNLVVNHEGFWLSVVAEPTKGFELRKIKLNQKGLSHVECHEFTNEIE